MFAVNVKGDQLFTGQVSCPGFSSSSSLLALFYQPPDNPMSAKLVTNIMDTGEKASSVSQFDVDTVGCIDNISVATIKNEITATYQQKRFEATLKYNESHQLYRPVTEPRYVGAPSAEIEAAWADILEGLTKSISYVNSPLN